MHGATPIFWGVLSHPSLTQALKNCAIYSGYGAWVYHAYRYFLILLMLMTLTCSHYLLIFINLESFKPSNGTCSETELYIFMFTYIYIYYIYTAFFRTFLIHRHNMNYTCIYWYYSMSISLHVLRRSQILPQLLEPWLGWSLISLYFFHGTGTSGDLIEGHFWAFWIRFPLGGL